MYRRSLLLLCSVGAVALTTAPAAFAGGEDPVTVTVTTPAPPPVTVTTPAPPPVTVTTPAPAPPAAPAPAPAPKKQSSNKKSTTAGNGGGENESSENQSVSGTSTFQTVAATHPIGGVQAGGGGTAPVPGDSSWLALALAGGSLLLLVSGGRLIAPARTRGR